MRKVKGLLGRIQFVDLAVAMAQPVAMRKDHLRSYLDRALAGGRMSSYEQFRRAIPNIYGVTRGLDLSPPPTLEQLQTDIKRACKGKDEKMNLEAATALFEFIRPLNYQTYDHPEASLPLGPGRRAAIRINHYVVDKDELRFQFVYPRRSPLNEEVMVRLLSMIQHTYAVDDYSIGHAEIVDMSCDQTIGPRGGVRLSEERNIRIRSLGEGELISMKDLAPDVQSVHDLLIEIGGEPD